MPLTDEQIKEYFRRGLAEGIPQDELISAVNAQLGEVPAAQPSGQIDRLRGQFAGTEAIPTEAIPPIPDVGFNELVPAMLKRSVGVPLSGVGETLGLIDEGTTAEMRDESEQTRVDYLAGDPHFGRTAIAGLTELGTELIPIAPGGALGKQVGKQVAKHGGKLAARLAGGATAGAAEGLVAGVGETVGMDFNERLRRGALITAAGAGMGALGGVRAVSGPDHGAKDPVVRRFEEKYGAGEPSKRSRNPFEKIRQQWEDSLRPVERAAQQGEDLAPGITRDTQLKMQAARTGESTSMAPIQDGVYDLQGNRVGESLDEIFGDLDGDLYADVNSYAMARHNIELARRAQEAKAQLPGVKEELELAIRDNDANLISALEFQLKDLRQVARIEVSKQSLKDSVDLVEHLSGKDKYGMDPQTGEAALVGDRAQRLTQFSNRAVLGILQEVGVFSKAQVDSMMRDGEWYVPFMRAIDELDRMETMGFLEPGLGMGSAPVKGRRIRHGLDSRKGLRVKDIYQEIGERAIRVHAFARKQQLRNHLADMADQFGEDIGLEVRQVDKGSPGNTFRVFRDGELLHYAADKDLLQAVETLNFKEANWVLRAGRTLTRVFRAGATLTPQFAFGNVARDMFTYGVYSKHGGIPFLSPARVVFEELSKWKFGLGKHSDEWQAFMRSSGGHSSFVEGDRFNVERHVDILRKNKGKSRAGSGRKLLREMKTNPLAPLQAMSSMLERPGRFAEFKAAKRAGLVDEAAGLASADVTLNFPRGGTIGRRLNLYEAFFNAMMQDISKFSRAMKERPFKTSTKALAWITAPSMAVWAKHQDNEDYQNLPEWEKALFLHLWQRDNGKFVRIPMPPGILGVMFSYLPRKAADFFAKNDPNAAREFFEEMAQQTPLQYIPLPGEVNATEDAFLNALPTPLQPIGEIALNRSPFFKRPVVSKRYERLPPSEQKTWRTTGAAKLVAGMGNAVGIPLSPIEVDHLFAGYGAGLGRQAANLTGTDAGTKYMEEDGIFRLPGMDRFLSTSPYGFSSQPVQDFYNFVDAVEEADAGLKIQSNQRRHDNFLQSHPEALYKKDVNKIRQQLREFAEWRNALREDETMERWEREDAMLKVDQEVTRYAAEIMSSLYEAIQMDKVIAQEKSDAPL